MAEQIIYDIKFNGAEQAQKALEAITKAQIAQQEQIAQTKLQVKAYEKALEDLRNEMAENESATEEQIELEKMYAESITESKLSLSAQKDGLAETNKQRREAIGIINAGNTALEAETGSNEQLRAQLKFLTKEYDLMSASERDNTDAGKTLTQQINNITEKLKENESAIGDNRRNVGNYEEAVTNALGKVNLFGVNLGQVTNAIKEGVVQGRGLIKTTMAQAQASSASATATRGATVANGGLIKSLNFVRVALIATGIGAIVVLLGALVGAFASTQRGADAFSRVITPIKFVMQGLLGVLQDLSFILVDKLKKGFDDFKNASIGDIFKSIGNSIKENILKRIEAFSVAGKAIVKLLKGDIKEGLKDLGNAGIQLSTGIENGIEKIEKAVEKSGESYDKLKDKIKESAKQGLEYANAQIAAEKAQIRLTTAIAQSNKELKEQRLIASDQTKTDAERQKALEKAIELSNIRASQQKQLVRNELNLAVLKTKQNDTDRSAYLEIAQLKAKLIDLDAQALSEQKMIASQLSGIQKKQQKEIEDRLKKIQELIKSEGERLINHRNAQLEELNLQGELTDLTEDEVKAREAIYNEYYTNLSKNRLKVIEQELEEQEGYLTAEGIALEKAYYNDLILLGNNEEAKKKLTEKYNLDKLNSLKDTIRNEMQIIEDELNPLTAGVDGGIISSLLSEDEKETLKKRLQELQAELAKTNYEASQIGVNPETGEKLSLAESLGLTDEQAQGITATYQSLLSAINTGLNIATQKLQENTQERIDIVDNALEQGTISEQDAEEQKKSIRKKAFDEQQKLEIAKASIQYFQGLISAFAQAYQLGPVAGPIVGGLNAGALTAIYGANLDSIKAQNFAGGGYVSGPGTGTSDSIPARLSNGEYVQTAKAVRHFGVDFMESINNLQMPSLFAEGGLVTPTPISNISKQVSKGITPLRSALEQQQIEVVNIESKFTQTQNKVKNVETAGAY